MEKQYQHTVNGQGVYSEDFNAMGEAGALADDRVLAEILRMAPLGTANPSPSRAIVPTDFSGQDGVDTGVVVAGTGSVRVMPFRAIIGSTTYASASGGANAKENWRGSRSAVFAGTDTTTSLGAFIVAVPTNDAAGNPGTRWDKLVAKIMPDKAATSVLRKVKSPIGGTVSTQAVVTNKNTEVTVELILGTTGAGHPPAIHADGGGAYYIELANIRIPAGYTTSSVLTQANIWDVAPCVAVSPATGGASCRPASVNCVPYGYGIGNTTFPQDPATDFPSMYLPQSMCGAQARVIALDFAASINAGDIVDDSMDWRGRIVQSIAFTTATTSRKFPWQLGMTASQSIFDEATQLGVNTMVQLGHSMATNSTGMIEVFKSALTALTHPFTLYADATTGALKVDFGVGAAPANKVVLWLTASGQFANRNVNW